MTTVLRTYKTKKPFEGVIGNLERRYKETESAGMREEIERYMSSAPCLACNGYRLKPEALAVKIDGLHVGQVSEMSIRAAAQWFNDMPDRLTDQQRQIGERVFKEIRERLGFLNDVGLDYLTLARNSGIAVRRRKPAHPPREPDRFGPDRRALCPRRALDRAASARQCAPARNAAAAARHRQYGDRRRARRGRHPDCRLCGRYRPRRRRPWRPHRGRGHARRHPQEQEFDHRPVSQRQDGDPDAARAPQGAEGQEDPSRRRHRQQPQERLCRRAARPVRRHHRRLRRRQVDADDRHHVPGHGAAAERRPRQSGPAQPPDRPRIPRQDHRHRPVADRPHAALQSGDLHRRLRPAARMVRRPARSQSTRLRPWPLLASTSRAAAARSAKATASSRSRCTSCPTSTSPAKSARATATIARRWKFSSRASRSPTCST